MKNEKLDIILDHLYGELEPDAEESFINESANSKSLINRTNETRRLLTAYRLGPIMEIPEDSAEKALDSLKVAMAHEEMKRLEEAKTIEPVDHEMTTTQEEVTPNQPVPEISSIENGQSEEDLSIEIERENPPVLSDKRKGLSLLSTAAIVLLGLGAGLLYFQDELTTSKTAITSSGEQIELSLNIDKKTNESSNTLTISQTITKSEQINNQESEEIPDIEPIEPTPINRINEVEDILEEIDDISLTAEEPEFEVIDRNDEIIDDGSDVDILNVKVVDGELEINDFEFTPIEEEFDDLLPELEQANTQDSEIDVSKTNQSIIEDFITEVQSTKASNILQYPNTTETTTSLDENKNNVKPLKGNYLDEDLTADIAKIELIAKQKEEARIAEIEKQKEEARIAEIEKQKEEARIAEIEKQKEEARIAEIEKQKEEARIAEIEKQKEEARIAEIEKQKEEARIAEIEKQKEEARIAEIEKQKEEARIAEIEKQKEEARIAEIEKLKEEARIAEIEKLKEEARIAEIEKQKEEARIAEIEKQKEEARIAEIEKQKEEARIAEIEKYKDEVVKVIEPIIIPDGQNLHSVDSNSEIALKEYATSPVASQIIPESKKTQKIEFLVEDTAAELIQKAEALYIKKSFLQALFGVEEALLRSPSYDDRVSALTLKARIELKLNSYSDMNQTIEALRPLSSLEASALQVLYNAGVNHTIKERKRETKAAQAEEVIIEERPSKVISITPVPDNKEVISTQPIKKVKKKPRFNPTTDTYYRRK